MGAQQVRDCFKAAIESIHAAEGLLKGRKAGDRLPKEWEGHVAFAIQNLNRAKNWKGEELDQGGAEQGGANDKGDGRRKRRGSAADEEEEE